MVEVFEGTLGLTHGTLVFVDLGYGEAEGDNFHHHEAGNEPVRGAVSALHRGLQAFHGALPHSGYPVFIDWTEAVGVYSCKPYWCPRKATDNGENGLKAPMIDVSDRADLPDQVGAKDIVPEALPDNKKGPCLAVGMTALIIAYSYLPFSSPTAHSRRSMLRDNSVVVEFARDVINNKGHHKLKSSMSDIYTGSGLEQHT